MAADSTLLRRAGPNDEPAILALAVELSSFPVPHWRTPEEIQRADDGVIHAILLGETDGAFAAVVEEAGVIVGAVCAREKDDYFNHSLMAYVEVLAVAPAARGKGIARRLLDAVEAWAREEAYAGVGLSVWLQNERARGLYEHLGYVPETVQYLKTL
jgi:ribosomal protein S18 acetylase RimI-like enzyme